MRVLTVLVALMATPVLTAVSQDRGHQAATWVSENDLCATADENRSPSSESNRQPDDPKGRDRVGCSPVPPPSTACGPATTGTTARIGGRVLEGDPFASLSFSLVGLRCIEVTVAGTNVTFTATTRTDDQGYYTFWDLEDGAYIVCVVAQGWQLTFPTPRFSNTTCPNGTLGWPVTLWPGTSASSQNFFMIRIQ